jgi:hypothetical protein
VIAKAWASEAFKQRLKADATKVLREEGVEVPRGIRVVANFDEVGLRNIVVPMKPRGLGAAETAAVARIWCSQFWCSLPW